MPPRTPHILCMSRGEPKIPTNPLSLMYKQATQEGHFSREKKEDDKLKHCWGQGPMVEGEDQQSGQALHDN